MLQSQKTSGPRSGLSLLEILISVFVLSIGLMGVAAVIPLGHHQMVEATKDDRAGACGRAGKHEVRTRGWLNPAGWRQVAVNDSDPINVHWAPFTFPVAYDTDLSSSSLDDFGIPNCDSFAIDPLFFAHPDNLGNPGVWRFPLDATAEDSDTDQRRNSLVRVTFDTADWSVAWPALPALPPGLAPWRMPFAAAAQTFYWRDDLRFPIPKEDPTERPRALASWNGGQGLAYPFRLSDQVPPPHSPATFLAADDYSWMATVTPILDGPGNDFWVSAPIPSSALVTLTAAELPSTWTLTDYWRPYSMQNRVTRYTVSIVVFHKRDFQCPLDMTDPSDPPQERTLQVMFPGDGFGGGDVLLYYDPAPAANPLGKSISWLNVKKGDWIMLRGLELMGSIEATIPALQPNRRVVAKWYQVVAVDEPVPWTSADAYVLASGAPVSSRYVTLSGPDWQVDKDGDGVFEPVDTAATGGGFFGATGFDHAEATLVDGVIGVYTTTVAAE